MTTYEAGERLVKNAVVTFVAASILVSSSASAQQSPFNGPRAEYCRQQEQIAFENCIRNGYDPFGVSGDFCRNSASDVFWRCLIPD
jgi:hypothetical protein